VAVALALALELACRLYEASGCAEVGNTWLRDPSGARRGERDGGAGQEGAGNHA